MSLKIKKKSGSSVPPMDAGTYPAVCVGIVDLGEQYSATFKKYNDKVLVIWEIPSQTIEIDGEDKPRWLSKDFSASLHEKSNLYQMLVSWRGKAFTEAELAEDECGFIQFKIKDMWRQRLLRRTAWSVSFQMLRQHQFYIVWALQVFLLFLRQLKYL